MTKINPTSKIVGVGLAALVALAPALAGAATYAYVNAGGDVQAVIAGNWQTAIANAPNIAARSGVILIDGTDSTLIDDNVNGV